MAADRPRSGTLVSSAVWVLRQGLSRLESLAHRRESEMMVETPKYRPSDEVDFLIVGSGAAGGILAKELSGHGFSVVVLEQGPYLTENDFVHDEIKVLQQDLLTNHPKLQPTTFRKTPEG